MTGVGGEIDPYPHLETTLSLVIKCQIINCICLSKLTLNNSWIISTEYQLSQVVKSQLMCPVNMILFSL